jgi:hypothetical protein
MITSIAILCHEPQDIDDLIFGDGDTVPVNGCGRGAGGIFTSAAGFLYNVTAPSPAKIHKRKRLIHD